MNSDFSYIEEATTKYRIAGSVSACYLSSPSLGVFKKNQIVKKVKNTSTTEIGKSKKEASDY